MISAYTGTQIREAEKTLLDNGMGAVLMQRASYGLANAVIRELKSMGRRIYGSSVTVLVGKGNNGGDGLFAAAFLAGRGMRTTAVLTAGDAHAAGLAAFRRAGGRTHALTKDNIPELLAAAASSDVVIDAVLGTGARGGLTGAAGLLMEQLQAKLLQPELLGAEGTPLVVACDIASGVDADTGELHGPVLRAHVTVTFGGAKAGLLADPGAGSSGRMVTVPIGIESALPSPVLRRLDRDDLKALLPQPERSSHKYSRGVLGVVAGSKRYPGAAVLACRGALAAGVGMVRYLGPPEVAAAVRAACPEVVCGQGRVADAHVQAWLVGSGLDDSAGEQLGRVHDALESGLPVIADAGALRILPGRLGAQVVLTPHAGELATLLTELGTATHRSEIEAAPMLAARRAATLTGGTVLLKGPTTVIATATGAAFTQAEGTPWMATAGSGDVLAGVLGALLAQVGPNADRFAAVGIDPAERWGAIAAMAASVHGLAGSAASEGGPLTAGRLADAVPGIWPVRTG
ncbi:NAD(P)H-hydrate dehydratase [Arthrobacter sp.]|uniref:bifunctional ADP-dependent NAD(P)H-hydrate dehydratase/NAD(P)H-hydrate epimerase n=1 Tax=Arthrobacter sp. TaxID=1667 RepID=UPI002810DFDB|nr:NAD(P)H-hydrate dehydratase [Arthrobacter sp.]